MLSVTTLLSRSVEITFAVTVALVGLAWMKAVMEPTATLLGQILFPRVLAECLVVLDQLLPQLLAEGATRETVEQCYRDALEAHFGDARWQRRGLEAVWQRFDVRVFMDRAAAGANEGQ